MYTDGNSFSLWRNGKIEGKVIHLDGDVETSGKSLKAPPELPALYQNFLSWDPIPPNNAKDLAVISARLCRLLRDEVEEELGREIGPFDVAESSVREEFAMIPATAADERRAGAQRAAVIGRG